MLDQKTYQVLQHMSQHRQCEPHKEEQQRCNSDQLNIPIKKKKGVGWRAESGCSQQETHIFVATERDVHR